MDEAEHKFLQAISNSPELAPKAMLNLSLIYQAKARTSLNGGDIEQARKDAKEASNWMDSVKEWIESDASLLSEKNELESYKSQYKPLRLQSHRLSGQIMAAMSDFEACEEEFKEAVENFPNEAMAWDMYARILELRGKPEEATKAKGKVNLLKSFTGGFPM